MNHSTNAKFYASYITSCTFRGIMYIQTPSAQPQLPHVHLSHISHQLHGALSDLPGLDARPGAPLYFTRPTRRLHVELT